MIFYGTNNTLHLITLSKEETCERILQNQLKSQKIQSTHYIFSPDTAH